MSHDKTEISEELQAALKVIIDKFQTDERSVRERQIRLWKKLDYYWNGFQRLWWSETAHDWRTFNSDVNNSLPLNDAAYYDRPINVYRAYLESIIAALSASVPPINCTPDDADSADDINTARGGNKIAELVYNHNDAPLLWVKALFTYCSQGMIAAYNCCKKDPSFGEVEVEEYEDEEQEIKVKVCPFCGTELTEPELAIAENIAEDQANEFDPSKQDVPILDANSQSDELLTCTACAREVSPELRYDKIIVSRITGVTKEIKSRQLIEVLGGLYVFVPNFAKNQEDTPLLGYMREVHYTKIYEEYPHLAEKYPINDPKLTGTAGNYEYERWGRLSTQYLGDFSVETPTLSDWWLRPRCYFMIPDEKLQKEAREKFPFGIRVTYANDIFVCARAEKLDDHWTIAHNPLSNYLHYDPHGLLLTSVQEITNDIISLSLQTIEQGVGQTFADPSVLDFNQYSKTEVLPGAIYPAKAKSGKTLAEGFFQISTASLGREVEPFADKINSMGQFVSGALPAIWGGSGPANQRTAGQAAQSRNQALQRLQTPWKMINFWWKNLFSKVIPAYIKEMLEDERIVRKQHNSFVNDTIKLAQLNGKIGAISIEAAENLPQTWAQVRDTLMQLVMTNNPQILEMLGSPANIGIMKNAIGLNDFNIPGEEDREKQFQEIKLLLQSQPMEGPDGQPIPSIMPELLVDNHIVEAEICRDWLVSEHGLVAKTENRKGYDNVVAHLKAHIMMMQQMQPQEDAPTGPQEGGQQQRKVARDAGRNYRTEQPEQGLNP